MNIDYLQKFGQQSQKNVGFKHDEKLILFQYTGENEDHDGSFSVRYIS